MFGVLVAIVMGCYLYEFITDLYERIEELQEEIDALK